MKRLYKFKKTITASSGSGSANTNNIIGGVCRAIILKATTATTRFRANLVDDDSVVVRKYEYRTGQIVDDKPLALQGIVTVNITDSTVDEDFTAKVLVEE